VTEKRDAYAAAGVNYDVIDPGKKLAQVKALETAKALSQRGCAEVGESRGESAYVVDIGDAYLSTVTEALGTKNLIADEVSAITGRSHYDAIAQDCVATILNDLATVGGAPLALTAYWGTGSSDWFRDQDRMHHLTEGWARACAVAGCSWGGGETQTITGIIDPGSINLAGAAVGIIRPKSRLLLGSRVAAGDAMLIAPATGLHANGATLARKIASQLPNGYATPLPGDPDGRSFGEVLLDATPLYGPLVEALQNSDVDLHYAVHVTGHGLRKLMRGKPDLTYVVEKLPPVLPIFRLLQDQAGMSDEEAFGTFNMGSGFALYLPANQVSQAVAVGKAAGFDLLSAGHIEAGPKRVILIPIGVTYEGASLNIR
jgi:phosphoribosylformylglycinamidine cyclo-ligase